MSRWIQPNRMNKRINEGTDGRTNELLDLINTPKEKKKGNELTDDYHF